MLSLVCLYAVTGQSKKKNSTNTLSIDSKMGTTENFTLSLQETLCLSDLNSRNKPFPLTKAPTEKPT